MGEFRRVVIAWLILMVATLVGFIVAPAVAGLGWYVAVVLAIMTIRRAKHGDHDLTRVGWYRAAVGLVLALNATAVVCASSFVIGTGTSKSLGLFAVSSVNVVIAILAWRALTKPTPRRAAALGALAVIGEVVALLIDAFVMHARYGSPHIVREGLVMGQIAMVSAAIAVYAGMLVCVFSLTLFRPSNLPEARVA